MRILVIGANGRLGRACVASLSANSHSVIALVRDAANFPPTLSDRCAAVIEADARNKDEIASALRDHRCDGVVQAGGYTPFWVWQTSNLPLVFAATLDAAEAVARERGDGVILPDKRIRAWMICDLGMMDSPWDDKLLWHYLPPMFPIHRTTFPTLAERPTEAVAWSVMCPAMMQPSDHKVAAYETEFGGPTVPNWRDTFLWIPLLGKYINAFFMGWAYMTTTYDRVANFLAEDFNRGLDSPIVGQKVGPGRVAGGKAFWF
ncbi:hypothetical protein B0T16DRAFT_420572 [Cercophora newfieldiana]|uniref:NAD(P)-binding domain-containing protein n=1 Tax=Cercophora newfieldiana TaxID=92897 RepID=A0AA39XX11_9PEZI|nr:hypothetical protein B0T16DRAFT_420572 [Cercophora newfieldiana]